MFWFLGRARIKLSSKQWPMSIATTTRLWHRGLYLLVMLTSRQGNEELSPFAIEQEFVHLRRGCDAASVARTSMAVAGSLPAPRMCLAASSTHWRLVNGVCQGASSRPTRTCPPRSIAGSISGLISTPRPATIHGARGSILPSSRKCASRYAVSGGKPQANSSENMNR